MTTEQKECKAEIQLSSFLLFLHVLFARTLKFYRMNTIEIYFYHRLNWDVQVGPLWWYSVAACQPVSVIGTKSYPYNSYFGPIFKFNTSLLTYWIPIKQQIHQLKSAWEANLMRCYQTLINHSEHSGKIREQILPFSTLSSPPSYQF